ncbi:hypothetical protein PS659_03184 [Pseudomonas fluorescens]|uniref:Uncharacterized protein n=1 Tax=Pseudomonas fluorescens TaxID=294 RepID=A0A5E6TYU7_PSEFL|nr:hypothetical protein PS659_03184 [Pseudomonas fluorescens]
MSCSSSGLLTGATQIRIALGDQGFVSALDLVFEVHGKHGKIVALRGDLYRFWQDAEEGEHLAMRWAFF